MDMIIAKFLCQNKSIHVSSNVTILFYLRHGTSPILKTFCLNPGSCETSPIQTICCLLINATASNMS